MIFQSKKEDPAEQAAPIAPAVDDQASQDEQDLAKVLADIDSQVNVNNQELAAAGEAAVEQSAPNQPTAEASDEVSSMESMMREIEDQVAASEQANIEAPAATMTETAEVAESVPTPETSETIDFEKIEEELGESPVMADFQPAETTNDQPTTPAPSTDWSPEPSADNNILPTDIDSAPSAVQDENTTPADTDFKPATGKVDYDALKKQALQDLRPILDRVKLNDEEAFDVLLLMIRETDDESLLDRAYEAARQIVDEGRRAQALLDVIKEAEYFKHKN